MWFSDADVQIIGVDMSEMTPLEKIKIDEKITKLNQQLRYKNIIKDLKLDNIKLKKEILKLKEIILKEGNNNGYR